jgi:molybdopterin converting factor subunit 1
LETHLATVHIQYFAALREQRGLSHETLVTTSGTPRNLYAELQSSHALSLPINLVKAAVNGEFAPMEQQLFDGDTVVFIPPVAGG